MEGQRGARVLGSRVYRRRDLLVATRRLPYPARMQYPDYQGGSIVNLMQSLIHARGHRPADAEHYPEAQLLPAAEITKARHVVLLVIDGLGDEWLQRHAQTGSISASIGSAP